MRRPASPEGRFDRNALHYYDYSPTPAARPARPPDALRILWVTSLRDVGAEDRNGARVEVPEGEFYMMGLLEALVRRTNGEALLGHFLAPDIAWGPRPTCGTPPRSGGSPRSSDWIKSLLMLRVIDGDPFLSDRVELAGVVVDDTERDLAAGRLGSYGLRPGDGRQWIAPARLPVRCGGRTLPLGSMVRHIPSGYRNLPLGDPRRMSAKAEFESEVARAFQETGANLIVLDHAMFIADALLRVHGLQSSILNIHPAITDPDHPDAAVGREPTARSLDRARRSERPVTTGATLHFVDEGIDTGPRLLVGDLTNVYAEDDPARLRLRNYAAKLLVFFLGVRHFAENVRPRLAATGSTVAGLRPVLRRVPLEGLLGGGVAG